MVPTMVTRRSRHTSEVSVTRPSATTRYSATGSLTPRGKYTLRPAPMSVIVTDMECDIPYTASPPDPPQDHPGNLAVLIHVVGILLGYGRHLLDTVRRRAAAPTFPTIAANFGTANLSTILAHLNRGLLRAAALERFLLARAATGRDIDFPTPRSRTDATPPTPADPQPEQPAVPKAARRLSLPPGWDDPEIFMPTPEDLDRQVRRRSLGRTYAEICNDLAVVPGFCTPAFWNVLHEIMHYFGGRGVETVMREKSHREQAFMREQDRKLDSTWDWLQLKRDSVRQALGFFIGEPPVDPFDQSPTSSGPAPVATGPP